METIELTDMGGGTLEVPVWIVVAVVVVLVGVFAVLFWRLRSS